MKSSPGPSRAGSGPGRRPAEPGSRPGRSAAPGGGASARRSTRGAAGDALEVARRVREGRFPASAYLEGPSEALKAEWLACVRRSWARANPSAPQARVLRAAESSVEEILALVQGASLFNPRDLILVLDIEDLGRSEKKVGALAQGLSAPAGESSLVLVESAADQPRKSLEPLRAACALRVVAMPPSRRDMIAWAALVFEDYALTAEPGVFESLADACEGDALAFFGELSRLISWTGDRGRASAADVAQILRPAPGAELPDYLAAVAAGDARLAGKRLGRLLAAGVGEGSILFALSNLVGGALGGWARFRFASDALRQRRGSADLMRALDAIYRAEAAWKGGRADVIALLEQATREVSGVA
jgi:DNA polymerase III delta subunit